MPLRGGGVGPLMANAILNFHFDYVTPSLTDKGRLHKCQKKFNKPANFILIMPDNVLGSGAPSSGKYMMFAEGELKESFPQGRLKFDREN